MYHILNSKRASATSKEIASHCNAIMMAGAVTTATFLSGTLYYLCHNRQALRRLQNEMRGAFPKIQAIRSKELMKCTYLNAVVEEGLRIYPPAGAAHLSRIVPKGGCTISGRFIPEGVRTMLRFLSLLSFSFSSSPCILPCHGDQNTFKLTLTRRPVYLSTLGLYFETPKTSTSRTSSSPNVGLRPRARVKRGINLIEACHFRTGREGAWEGSECDPFRPHRIPVPCSGCTQDYG